MSWMIYEYRCKVCGIKFEAMVKLVGKIGREIYISPECPECGSIDIKKLLSSTYGIVK